MGNCLLGSNTSMEVPEPLREEGVGHRKEMYEEQQDAEMSLRTVVQESWEMDRDQRRLRGRKGFGMSSSRQC